MTYEEEFPIIAVHVLDNQDVLIMNNNFLISVYWGNQLLERVSTLKTSTVLSSMGEDILIGTSQGEIVIYTKVNS